MVRRGEHTGQSRSTALTRSATGDRATATPVSAAALDNVDVDDEQARLAAESLERRQADLELRNELALAGFRGPGWDRYALELARYGYAVMMAWLKTGEVFNHCKAMGCNLGSLPWSGRLMTEPDCERDRGPRGEQFQATGADRRSVDLQRRRHAKNLLHRCLCIRISESVPEVVN